MVTDGGEDIRYQEEQKTIKKIHEERERKRKKERECVGKSKREKDKDRQKGRKKIHVIRVRA